MKKPRLRMLIAAALLVSHFGLVAAPEARADAAQDASLVLGAGMQYFDKGIEASNSFLFAPAKQYMRLALSIFMTLRAVDPKSGYAKSFAYLAKGFMYHMSGAEMRNFIEKDSDNYTVMVQLRRGYYPLKHSQLYYDLALKSVPPGNEKMTEYVKSLRARNEEELKLVRQFLPQVDYKAEKFLRTTDTEAVCVVNFDRMNDAIAEGDYAAVDGIAGENRKLCKKLTEMKTDNAAGFLNLTEAYPRLAFAVSSLNKDANWLKTNYSAVSGSIDEAQARLTAAETGFADMALSNLCTALRQNLIGIRSRLREITGVSK